MPRFGSRSLSHLVNVHPLLVLAAHDAIEILDFSVTCGLRNDEDQQKAFDEGHSTKEPGESKHNYNLDKGRKYSWAIDMLPYPFRGWDNDDVRFAMIAMTIIACMRKYGLIGRWGNDWDRDGIPVNIDPDERFRDLPHIEIVEVIDVKEKEHYSFIPIED